MRLARSAGVFFGVLFSVVLCGGWQSQVRGQDKEWVFLHDGVSQECERLSIPLKFVVSSSTFYSCPTAKIKSQRIESGCEEGRFTERLDFGEGVDGYEYSALVGEAADVKFIDETSSRLCEVKILRTLDRDEAETLKEGYLFLGKGVDMTVGVCARKLGIPVADPVSMSLNVTVSRSSPPAYDGSLRVSIGGRLSGSVSTDEAMVGVTLTCKDSAGLADRYVSVAVKAFDDEMVGGTASGAVSDILAVGSAKVVVEKMAGDGSEIVLAVVHGELVGEKETVPEKKSPLETGKGFPGFARVELVNRRLMTLDDLKKEAGCAGYVTLFFGNMKRSLPEHFGGMPQVRNVTLNEEMICDMVKKDVKETVVIGFVCQELLLSDLYEEWADGDMGFYVLSDYSNPLDVQFSMAGMQRMYYGPPRRAETLRGQLGLADDKVITALIDGKGYLVYLNTDAGGGLAGSLVEMNKIMREGRKSEKGDKSEVACEGSGGK